MHTPHPDTSELGHYMVSFAHMVNDVKKQVDILRLPTAPDRVIADAVFALIDAWVQNRMHWTHQIDQLRVWCDKMNLDFAELTPGNKHEKVISYINNELNYAFSDILPNRTWRVLSLRRVTKTFNMVLEIGDDYRIVDWMRTNGHDR